MNDSEALLRAICRHPDEDAPRLIYADWLQEHGNEARAELIRVECALPLMPEADPARASLADRRRALWERHGARWRAALPGRPGIRWCSETARGFFYEIAVRDIRAAERHGPAILSSEAVQRVRLEKLATLSGFARLPLLEAVDELDVWHEAGGGAGLAHLACSPHAVNLRKLVVYAEPAEEARLIDLLATPRIPHLTEFLGSGLSVPAAGGESPRASASLRLLLLADCRFAPGALSALFGLPAMGALDEVRLQSSGDSGDALAAALAGATHVRNLRALNLKETSLTEVGAAAFAAPHLRSLRKVVLTRGLVPPAAVRAIRRALPEANVRVDTRR